MTRSHTLATEQSRGDGPMVVVAWCLCALIVAVLMSFAASILIVDVLDAAIDPLTGGAVVPDPIAVLLTGLLVGGSLGAVVGSRIDRRPVAVSVAVLIVYMLIWPMLWVLADSALWLSVSIVVHVVSAVLAAHLLSRGRLARQMRSSASPLSELP